MTRAVILLLIITGEKKKKASQPANKAAKACTTRGSRLRSRSGVFAARLIMYDGKTEGTAAPSPALNRGTVQGKALALGLHYDPGRLFSFVVERQN